MGNLSKVLLVSHNFPPTAGPESSLVKMNAEFLHRSGLQVRVLTTTQAHATQAMDASLLRGLPGEILIDRVPSPEAVVMERSPHWGRLAVLGTGRFILPEVYLPWMFPATVRAKSIVKEWRPDVIYSRASKHVSNVVGWRLKRATGLPWVAHFSDPWISAGLRYKTLQRMIGLYFERKILRDADALVFVAPQTAECVLSKYPQEWRQRVHIIPHGYEPQAAGVGQLDSPGGMRRALKVIHAGAFYPNLRTPDALIEALRRLGRTQSLAGRLEITCIGVDTTCFQPQVDAAGVGDVLKLQGGVPFDECQRQIASSDLTLIIDMPGHGGVFLPTKLIEAFAYDHPVLGLAEKKSAVADVLRETHLHWADSKDPDHIARCLAQLLEAWESGRWGLTAAQRQGMDRFHIDRINQPLLGILRKVTEAGYRA
ncbi:glycosyltransferase [Prosthecobacter dejongeii]|uniref:Glycosyltransferase involved in cell wall biosynthesis n=1 Tax=Prosthecobacter dejongeii TaxID=48465 RepID=A0A7W7YIW1_9BACT|nr:glycosyltransferase [Prosthecobacter dejongeii]MBB5036867.1 glycosyltransferase involved in cell wall biosynthesis [Prosthecobacter dejongeii]